MNYNEIRALTEWLEKSSFTTYSLTTSSVSISISKEQLPPTLGSFQESLPAIPVPTIQTQEALPIQERPTMEKAEKPKDGHLITSPIVGIYYESTSPGSPAFVKVGEKVKKGDVLCILEAMKVMNEITSDVDGVVAEVLMSNGEMVEACMPLFRIET